MQKIVLYMATHGPKCINVPPLCQPIEVGSALRTNFNYSLKDNEGENISEKNTTFNELTALYWAWKNSDADIIGLYHYRRVLDISPDQISKALNQYDVIIPRKTKLLTSVKQQYIESHVERDFQIFEEALFELYPEYKLHFERFFNQREMNFCNMFIAERKFVEDYCNWAFPLYEAIEARIDLSGRDPYQKRVIGFISERAFGYYIYFNQFKTKEVPMRHINYDDKLLQFKLNLAQYKTVRTLYKPLRTLKNALKGK